MSTDTDAPAWNAKDNSSAIDSATNKDINAPKLIKSWGEILTNPPMHRAASGASVPRMIETVSNGTRKFVAPGDAAFDVYSASRERELGAGNPETRRQRHGILYQYWQTDLKAQTVWSTRTNSAQSSLDGNKRYGFKFHYNPSSVSHSVGVITTGVDTGLIASGGTNAIGITGGGATGSLTITLYLNRIEDMALFKVNRDGVPTMDYRDIEHYYGTLTKEEIIGIYNRGTGYDLEFLYRAVLGRSYDTYLRGNTADLGMAFALPSVLDLSAGAVPGEVKHGQRYAGLVTSVDYTHLSFNERMVPLWTMVNISFRRVPDGVPGNTRSVSGGYLTLTPQEVLAREKAARLLAHKGVTPAAAAFSSGSPTGLAPLSSNDFNVYNPQNPIPYSTPVE